MRVLIETECQGVAAQDPLRVIGYGDRNFAKDTTPPLSTRLVEGTRIGALVATMLVDRMERRAGNEQMVDGGLTARMRTWRNSPSRQIA
jgi:LacI family gluconate utilization system Gnt-I transcriptional repressor